MLRYILLLTFLPFLSSLSAQDKKCEPKNEHKQNSFYKREHLPGTVVFKIRQDKKEEFSAKKENINPELTKIMKTAGMTGLSRKYPNSKPPRSKTNKLGQPLIDLTSIYVLKYSSGMEVEEVVKKLKSTGLVEFAEPYFINEPLTVYIPNDRYVQPDSIQEFYYTRMKAYEAFAVEKGDTNVVVGVIDTGVKWDHEDIIGNIKFNWADPINGIDDDLDGYTDNFRGWDVYYNDNDPTPPVNDHGTVVAGCASATTDNTLGVAGTGFNCKLLPIKAASNSGGAIFPGYDGIVYAAEHGANVINLSWGGPNQPSDLEQMVINYAVFNWDAVVVAAAGNTPSDLKFYPASYDNVLCVASIDTMYHAGLDSIVEVKAVHSTFNYWVDVGAAGRRVASTTNSGYGGLALGTSFACPLVSGLAGLVRSKYPTLNALQVAELIRVTADTLIDSLVRTKEYKEEKLGKGRINMYRALTDNVLPAIRMYRENHYDKFGPYAFSDDTVWIDAYFRNYLQPTVNAKITLSAISPNVTVVNDDFTIGNLNTLDSTNNASDPFVIYIHPEAGPNETAILRLGMEDAATGYTDFQYFEILLNPSFLDIDTNLVTLTMTSSSKLGYIDDLSTVGNGLEYKGESLIFEGGLMIGSSFSKVSDCVRGNPAGNVDADFSPVSLVKYVTPFEGDQATEAVFTDIGSPDSIGLSIKQRSYAYKNSPDDKYIIIEYDITNESGSTLDSLCAGLFCDWDISNYNQNKANWLQEDSLGYVYYTGANGIHAGVSLLTPNPPACYSMDHGPLGGNNINPNDGFPATEKFTTLASRVARPQAGGSGLGFDVSQVVGGVLYDILPGQTKTRAFAMVVGDDVLDIKENARRARDLFRSLNTSPTPVASDFHYCSGDTVNVTISPSPGTRFRFYNSIPFVNPIHTGDSYLLNNLTVSDTIYIKGIDSLFESSAVPVHIFLHSELAADFVMTPDTVDLEISPNLFLVDKSQNANQIHWTISDGTESSSSSFLHTFNSTGTYTVTLSAEDNFNCKDSISRQVVVIGSPSTYFPFVQDGVKIYPNPSSGEFNIEFFLPEEENISISIVNALGEEVYKAEGQGIQFKNYLFNAAAKGKGIFYARIKMGEKRITRKILIQ